MIENPSLGQTHTVVKGVVAVTDNDWYRFLRERPDLDEVNFWTPSGKPGPKSLVPGAPFLFKLHAPENYVVGGGFFTHTTILPSTIVWKTFGDKNGAATYDGMRRRIAKYRHEPPAPHEDYKIGCILLASPFFFERADWIPAPTDFKSQTVRWKGYDLNEGIGKQLWQAVQERIRKTNLPLESGEPRPAPMFGDPVLVKPRLGQGTFRILVTDVCRVAQRDLWIRFNIMHLIGRRF
jgi:putative restriction endonuclease